MSVLIKGMDMPKSCFHCYFCDFGQCKLNPNITVIKNWLDKTLYKKCPLVGVPTPHGRLIDAEALMECRLEPNHYDEKKDGYIPDFELDSAPTIIEAEASE